MCDFEDRFEVHSVSFRPECKLKTRRRFYARMAAEGEAVRLYRDRRYQTAYAYVTDLRSGNTVYTVGRDPREAADA